VTQLQLSGVPNPAVQNTSYNLTVTALDSGGHIVPGYRGIVTLARPVRLAARASVQLRRISSLPATAVVHTFSTQLVYTGADTLTVTDAGTPSLTASMDLTVNSAAGGRPARLSAGQTPNSVPIGFPFQPFDRDGTRLEFQTCCRESP